MAIGSITPFRPTGTASLSAGTSSATVALAGGGDLIVVTNTTASLAYVRFGADPSVSASVADMPVMANSRVMLSANNLVTHGAAVLASGSGTVSVHPRRRILRLMAFTDAEKTDIRRFCGYPAYGAANSGFQNWRFFPGLWLAGIPDE